MYILSTASELFSFLNFVCHRVEGWRWSGAGEARRWDVASGRRCCFFSCGKVSDAKAGENLLPVFKQFRFVVSLWAGKREWHTDSQYILFNLTHYLFKMLWRMCQLFLALSPSTRLLLQRVALCLISVVPRLIWRVVVRSAENWSATDEGGEPGTETRCSLVLHPAGKCTSSRRVRLQEVAHDTQVVVVPW